MPITPFLRGHAFEPETVKNMGDAFAEACTGLGLHDRSDRFAEIIARRIIELAERGVRTKTALYLLTVQEFRDNPQ